MKIDLHKIPIREVIVGYKDSAEEGVVAYSGKLDIRPKYQREFVYTGKQRDAVIETIKNGFPHRVQRSLCSKIINKFFFFHHAHCAHRKTLVYPVGISLAQDESFAERVWQLIHFFYKREKFVKKIIVCEIALRNNNTVRYSLDIFRKLRNTLEIVGEMNTHDSLKLI